MKAPPFAYIRPESLDACLAALAAHGDGAEVLAGGQSLMPMLNLRAAAPAALIDISRLPSLGTIAADDGALVIGALATHAEIGDHPLVHRSAPLLAAAGVLILTPV